VSINEVMEDKIKLGDFKGGEFYSLICDLLDQYDMDSN
jgi:hypothetical protein